MSSDQPTVFISYSHKDEACKDFLVSHLRVLETAGRIEAWHDEEISAGDDWKKQIRDAMAKAKVAILLISADALGSTFILKEEVPYLLERRDKDGLHIIPVIIRPCNWEAVAWLSAMQVRPQDGRPVSGGNAHQQDLDMKAIVQEVSEILKIRPAPQAQNEPCPADRMDNEDFFWPFTALGKLKTSSGLSRRWANIGNPGACTRRPRAGTAEAGKPAAPGWGTSTRRR